MNVIWNKILEQQNSTNFGSGMKNLASKLDQTVKTWASFKLNMK